jgi:hypothetical protein
MNPLNYYRFGAYAILAMGLINLRYQTGSEANLPKSSALILLGLAVLLITFIPVFKNLFLLKISKVVGVLGLVTSIIYGFLI